MGQTKLIFLIVTVGVFFFIGAASAKSTQRSQSSRTKEISEHDSSTLNTKSLENLNISDVFQHENKSAITSSGSLVLPRRKLKHHHRRNKHKRLGLNHHKHKPHSHHHHSRKNRDRRRKNQSQENRLLNATESAEVSNASNSTGQLQTPLEIQEMTDLSGHRKSKRHHHQHDHHKRIHNHNRRRRLRAHKKLVEEAKEQLRNSLYKVDSPVPVTNP